MDRHRAVCHHRCETTGTPRLERPPSNCIRRKGESKGTLPCGLRDSSRVAPIAPRAELQTRAFRVTACTLISIPALVGSGALADRPAAPFTAPADRTLEEIVVTGTRLRITAIETVAPVTVLSRRDIERGGADSIGKVLQTLPAVTGSPLNTNVNAHYAFEPNLPVGGSGDGSVRADLRGGFLTLLNGRRFPNGGIGADASVDLNSRPVSDRSRRGFVRRRCGRLRVGRGRRCHQHHHAARQRRRGAQCIAGHHGPRRRRDSNWPGGRRFEPSAEPGASASTTRNRMV